MKNMGLNELREAYLKFFEEKGHYRMPSFSLVPKNDKSLLLILNSVFVSGSIKAILAVAACSTNVKSSDFAVMSP